MSLLGRPRAALASLARFGVPPPGTAPGTLRDNPQAEKPHITVTGYGPETLVENEVSSAVAAHALVGDQSVTWINVEGLDDSAMLYRMGQDFGLHRLTLEDIVNVSQRPKVEVYPEYAFMVTRMLTYDKGLHVEQISMVLGPKYLLTFQERCGDVFEPVRVRMREGKGRMRHAGPGYLAYALLDAVIDHYFVVLEQMGETLDALEQEALYDPRKDTIERIYAAKGELLHMRRSVWPQRDMLHALIRDESELFGPEDRVHMQDVQDHVLRVMDLVESYREMSTGLMDVHLSSISNRMNEVMKVLTLFSSIFIPLGFIAGLYGMNFDTSSVWNMPELSWAFGYVFALGVMLAVAGSLLIFFWRRGWIGK